MAEVSKKKTLIGIVWSFFGTFGQQVVGFVISIFLARLLSPTEFGLVGIAMVVISFSQLITDMGFASALIKNKDNTDKTYSTVFWFNLAISLVLIGIIQLSAKSIANFFDQSQVEDLIRILTIVFLIDAFNIVQRTILMREIKFKVFAIRNVTAQVFAGGVGVYLAFLGYGVYALVFQSIISGILTSLLLWNTSDWRPSFMFSTKEFKKLWIFGINVSLANIIHQIIKKLDIALIGKFFSPELLGLYTRAQSFNNLVIRYTSTSIVKVFYPVLCRIEDLKKKELYYLELIWVIALLSFFIVGTLQLSGEFVFTSLFGEKWLPSVPIFQVIIFKTLASSLIYLMGNYLLSSGHSKLQLSLTSIRGGLDLTSYFFLMLGDLQAFLYYSVSLSAVYVLLGIYFIWRKLQISFFAQLKQIAPILYGSLLLVFMHLSDEYYLEINWLMSLGGFTVLYALISVICYRDRIFKLYRNIVH
jgi:O-antigen/teichoic acid export membrane protein